MKVYESSHPTKGDFKRVPQIKIKNSHLEKSGFEIGKEFTVTYQQDKIILELKKEAA
jgi:Toxin SymE, type I toxin-antitoxin system